MAARRGPAPAVRRPADPPRRDSRADGQRRVPPAAALLRRGRSRRGGRQGAGRGRPVARLARPERPLAARHGRARPRAGPPTLAAAAASAPGQVVLKTGATFHPETLSMFVSTAALVLAARMLVRGDFRFHTAFAAGVVCGLGQLVRNFSLWTFAAILLALGLAAAAKAAPRRMLALAAAARRSRSSSAGPRPSTPRSGCRRSSPPRSGRTSRSMRCPPSTARSGGTTSAATCGTERPRPA